MDASNLPLSLNIDDRRNENYTVNYPTRIQILASLVRGLLKPPPPPLTPVETWNGDPNMQYGDTKLPPLGSRGPYAGVPSAPPQRAAGLMSNAFPPGALDTLRPQQAPPGPEGFYQGNMPEYVRPNQDRLVGKPDDQMQYWWAQQQGLPLEQINNEQGR